MRFILAFLIALPAHAAVMPVNPDITIRSDKPLELQRDQSTCNEATQPRVRVYHIIQAEDGTMVVIGAMDIRKRC